VKFHRLIVGIALGCVAVPGLTQDADDGLEGPLARLPESMFDIECRVSSLDGGALGAACWDPSKGPIVSVNTYPIGRDLSYEELVERMRENFRTAGSLQVIEEEPFAIESAPGATTMRADYQTEKAARKFTWSAAYEGNYTRVILTVADNAKREDFEDEVMAKVFGPDRYVPDASAAQ